MAFTGTFDLHGEEKKNTANHLPTHPDNSCFRRLLVFSALAEPRREKMVIVRLDLQSLVSLALSSCE